MSAAPTTAVSATAQAADVGIVVTGNSGVGKSFICDLLLQEDRFKHAISAISVTAAVERAQMTIPVKGRETKVAVFNIPGLIESDPAKWARNKGCFTEAIGACPTQIIMFVFGNNNGRLMEQDVAMFQQMMSVYGLKEDSLIAVFNQHPVDTSKVWEESIATLLRETSGWKGRLQHVALSTIIPGSNGVFNFRSASAVENRIRLLSAIEHLVPASHKKIGELVHSAQEINKLKARIDSAQKTMDANRKVFQAELQTARH